jgi:hypothetical protein
VLTAVLSWLPTFLADFALLLRMLAVYPPATTPQGKLLSILLPAVVIKLVRVVATIIFVVQLARVDLSTRIAVAVWTRRDTMWLVIERAAAALDNGSVCLDFCCPRRVAHVNV